MNDLMKRMRHRRFQIKPAAEVQLFVETMTGAKYEFRVDNVSITGIAGWTESAIPSDEGMDIGAILAAAKLTFKDHEYTLGRVVLRVMTQKDGKTWIAVSMIDAKVPVDSSLSHYFSQSLEEPETPFEVELSPDRFSLANFAESSTQNVDLFAKVHHFNVYFNDWEKTGKFSYKNVRLPSMGQRVRLAKKRKNGREDYIIMGSNDYLGLAAHPAVREAAKKAIDDYGFGSTGSPVTTGTTEAQVELSELLAKMFQKEKVILFNSGYAANIGTISGLIHPQDLVISDMLAHASIQDGMQMCKGVARFHKHNSVKHLERVLRENRDQHAGCLIVSEGVFSMDGDQAPLDEIIRLAREYKARVMVDEAHSFGVLGHNGLGACEKYNVLQQTDIIMGTFSKICGGIGGFIAANESVCNWVYSWARSQMFSVSIPPSTAAAALKALEIFRSDRTLLQNLKGNIEHFKSGLASLGYHLPANHESAVIPVVVGDEKKVEIMNQTLMENGVSVIPIVYPAVSKNNSRFRFTMMATQSISDLDYVLNVLELAMEKAKLKFEGQEPGKKPKAA